MLRFLIHIWLASVVAPVVGVAAYFLLDWWSTEFADVSISRTLLFAGLGGLYALFFVAFITLPFGLFSSVVCYRMSKSQALTLGHWVVICTLLGLSFGAFMGVWGSISVTTCALIGTVIGAGYGIILRKIWTFDWSRVH